MNLINDLDSELAYAVLIEKKHAEKMNSEEIIPLLKRLNDALRSISAHTDQEKKAGRVALAADAPRGFSR